jgi:hypothetical protein
MCRIPARAHVVMVGRRHRGRARAHRMTESLLSADKSSGRDSTGAAIQPMIAGASTFPQIAGLNA